MIPNILCVVRVSLELKTQSFPSLLDWDIQQIFLTWYITNDDDDLNVDYSSHDFFQIVVEIEHLDNLVVPEDI